MADDLEMARAIRAVLAANSPMEAGRASGVAEALTPPGAAAQVCFTEWRALDKIAEEPGADPRLLDASQILFRAQQELGDIARAMVNDLEDAARPA